MKWITNATIVSAWPYVVVALIVLALIEVGHASLPPYLFPDTLEIVRALATEVKQNFGEIVITSLRFLVSLATATLAGWFIGLLMGAFRRSLSLVMKPMLSVLQAVPALSWVLFSTLWMANVETRIWFVCFMLAMPFYAIAVYEGIRDIDSELFDAIDQFRPSRWQVIRLLLIPQSLVYLLISMRSVSALVLKILVFAELIGASTGIGQAMGTAQSNFRIDKIFAWTVVMIVGNFAILAVIDLLERYLLSWRKEAVVR